MSLVFLDTETTGLDPRRHHVWEIAYAVGDGPIRSCVVEHSTITADPTALTLNGYYGRIQQSHSASVPLEFESTLRDALAGATLVGSNPAFDASFLFARWGVAPWHHRLLDVAAYGMGVLNLDAPIGLAALASHLGAQGYEIDQPDHTAAADVAALRSTFRALRQIAGGAA